MIFTSNQGEIEHVNYHNNENLIWTINSTCNAIRVWLNFRTEKDNDILSIDGVTYSGINLQTRMDATNVISQVISKSKFIVQFQSNHARTEAGFRLQWECDMDWSLAQCKYLEGILLYL